MINDRVKMRLYNWKFQRALEYAQEPDSGATLDEIDTLELFARVFGNSGTFEGDMSEIARYAVAGAFPGIKWPDQ